MPNWTMVLLEPNVCVCLLQRLYWRTDSTARPRRAKRLLVWDPRRWPWVQRPVWCPLRPWRSSSEVRWWPSSALRSWPRPKSKSKIKVSVCWPQFKKKKQKWQGSIDPVNFFSLTVLCFREKKMTNSNLIKTIASTYLVIFLRKILSLPPITLSVPSAGVFYQGHFPTFYTSKQRRENISLLWYSIDQCLFPAIL